MGATVLHGAGDGGGDGGVDRHPPRPQNARMPGSVRAALRAFQQRPALSFGIVALYALAVGFAGGLWATIDATLLRPLPYPDPGRLVAVIEQHADRGEMGVTPASFLDWSTATGAFDGVGGAYALDLSFATGGLPTRVAGASVTEGYFAAWQVPAALGRTLSADDFGTGRAVVIDHAVWQEHYGGRLDVLGAPARIDGRVYTVVGVMPPTFRVPGNVHAWVPWVFSSDERRDRRSHLVGVIARLRAGTTPAAAARELETFYAGLRRAHLVMDGWSPIVRPLRAVLLGDVSRALTLMGAAVACLITVALVNMVALLAGSWPARRREIAVRLTLGASIRQVVTPLVVEIGVWALAGAGAGLGVAHGVIAVFSAWLPALDRFAFLPRIDARLIAAVAVFLTMTLLAIALGPLLAFVRREADLSPRRHAPSGTRTRAVAASAQVAGAVVLLSLAITLAIGLRDLEGLAGVDEGRLAMDVGLSELDAADDSRQRAFFATLLERVSARGEVAAVGAASYVPPTPPQGTYRFEVVGRPPDATLRAAVTSAVNGSAFTLLGVSPVRGRLLADSDGDGAPPAAVVSESFARRYLDGDPLGQQLRLAAVEAPLTIVGVVTDVLQPLAPDARIEALLYVPFRQVPWPFMTLLVEPRGDPAAAGAGGARRGAAAGSGSGRRRGPPPARTALALARPGTVAHRARRPVRAQRHAADPRRHLRRGRPRRRGAAPRVRHPPGARRDGGPGGRNADVARRGDDGGRGAGRDGTARRGNRAARGTVGRRAGDRAGDGRARGVGDAGGRGGDGLRAGPKGGAGRSVAGAARRVNGDRAAARVCGDGYFTCRPPSTRTVSPVTKSLATKNATTLAISASPPQRPSGVDFSTAACSSAVVPGGATIGPGAIGVHEDLVGGQFERQRLGQRLHARLGDVVGEEARIARPAAGRDPVREVHDPPAARLAHVRHRRPAAQERRPQVHRQLAIPVVFVLVLERHLLVERGHVHQDVEPAHRRRGFVDCRPALQGIAEVGVERVGLAAAGPHHRRGALGRVGRHAIGERHVGAAFGQHRGHGIAHPRAAGDERGFSLQVHGVPPAGYGPALRMVACRPPRVAALLCCADGTATAGARRPRARHAARRFAAAARRGGEPVDAGRGRGHRLRPHGPARGAPGLPRHLRARGGETVRRISLVSEYRRVVLLTEERIRLGDLSYSVRQMSSDLKPWRGSLQVIVELAFHPQNTYIGVPLIDVLLVPLDDPGRLPLVADATDRIPRFGLFWDPPPAEAPWWPFPPVAKIVTPRAEPVTGGWVQARFDAETLASGRFDVTVKESAITLGAAAFDLGSLR